MGIGNIVCLNGSLMQAGEAHIPAVDEGLLYGMGLFETIRVAGGLPGLLDRHLDRLFSSARALGLEVRFSKSRLTEMIFLTASANKMDEGGLRLTVTAKGAALVQARPPSYGEAQYRRGISAGWAAFRRNESSPLVRHKTLNYYENIIARRQARDAGLDEALFLNTAGALAEGSVSNIFLVKGGRAATPGQDCGLLPGIVRGLVIEWCAAAGFPPEERTILPEELEGAEECFATNSLMGVMPVTRIGEAVIGEGRPGELTRRLMAEIKFY